MKVHLSPEEALALLDVLGGFERNVKSRYPEKYEDDVCRADKDDDETLGIRLTRDEILDELHLMLKIRIIEALRGCDKQQDKQSAFAEWNKVQEEKIAALREAVHEAHQVEIDLVSSRDANHPRKKR